MSHSHKPFVCTSFMAFLINRSSSRSGTSSWPFYAAAVAVAAVDAGTVEVDTEAVPAGGGGDGGVRLALTEPILKSNGSPFTIASLEDTLRFVLRFRIRVALPLLVGTNVANINAVSTECRTTNSFRITVTLSIK